MIDGSEKLVKNLNHRLIPGAPPVGTGVGTDGTAIAGTAAGKSFVAEIVDPKVENDFWKEHFRGQPYVDRTRPYSHYQDAYRFGWESHEAHPGRTWSEVEHELAEKWQRARNGSMLAWSQAKGASQAAWNRVEKLVPGEAVGVGR